MLAPPGDALFPEDWIYDYGLRDELAVCAYWTSRYAECRDDCDRLLGEGKLPAEHRARVVRNRDLAVARLSESDAALASEVNHLPLSFAGVRNGGRSQQEGRLA